MATIFGDKDSVPPFGEYLNHFGLGDKAPEAPKPQKSAKELIAWAQNLTEKARAEKAKAEKAKE